jgi:hypothetical protein
MEWAMGQARASASVQPRGYVVESAGPFFCSSSQSLGEEYQQIETALECDDLTELGSRQSGRSSSRLTATLARAVLVLF